MLAHGQAHLFPLSSLSTRCASSRRSIAGDRPFVAAGDASLDVDSTAHPLSEVLVCFPPVTATIFQEGLDRS